MSNSNFECPQCGAMVYYELDRCPECGLDFYPPDDECEEDPKPSRARGWGTSLAAILVGWLASFSVFIWLAISRTDFHEATDWQAQSLLLIAGAAFIGGYIAGSMAKHKPILHGILVAMLSVTNAVLLETLWRDITRETFIRPMTLLAWGLAIVSGVIGAVAPAWLRRQRAARAQNQADREDDLYRDLLVRVRHDQGVADRLIAFERQRDPSASESELIENAIARWQHDNR